MILSAEIEPVADTNHWRIWRAHKSRYERPRRPNPNWAARELSYWCTVSEPRFAYYIEIALPLKIIGPAVSHSHYAGERIVRLRYDWRDIERHELPTKQLSDDVLSAMASEGGRLRAALDYARHAA